MEDALRRLCTAPNLDHVRESNVTVRAMVKDDTVDWPQEAVRRGCIELFRDTNLLSHPAIAACSDRLCAYVPARVAQTLEEEGIVAWAGDPDGEVADGKVVVKWPQSAPKCAEDWHSRLVEPFEDILELGVLDIKIDVIEWWTDSRPKHVAQKALAGESCEQCGQLATTRCVGLIPWQAAPGGVPTPTTTTGKMWQGCDGALCDACGVDMGLPTRPL